MTALSLLFAAAWKGSLLVALVLVLTRALRQRMPPRWAHTLLLVAIVRLLLPFAPESPVSIFNLALERDTRLELSVTAATPHSAPVALRGPLAPPAREERFPWQQIVLALWLGGATIALTRIAAGWVRTRAIVRDATPIEAWSESALLLESVARACAFEAQSAWQ